MGSTFLGYWDVRCDGFEACSGSSTFSCEADKECSLSCTTASTCTDANLCGTWTTECTGETSCVGLADMTLTDICSLELVAVEAEVKGVDETNKLETCQWVASKVSATLEA